MEQGTTYSPPPPLVSNSSFGGVIFKAANKLANSARPFARVVKQLLGLPGCRVGAFTREEDLHNEMCLGAPMDV